MVNPADSISCRDEQTLKGMADMALGFSARVEDMATTPEISSLIHWWHFCKRQKTFLHWDIKHCSAFHLPPCSLHCKHSTKRKTFISSPGGAEQQRIPIIDWAGWISKPCHHAQHASDSHLSLSANSRTWIKSAVPLSYIGLICVTPACWLSHAHILLLCYCARKRENEQGNNPKYSINLQLKASPSSLSQASRAWSRTAVFQCFQDPFQAVHSWSYSVAHEGTLYPCQGSAAAKSAFISSSISPSP